jgi:hypothetical protein
VVAVAYVGSQAAGEAETGAAVTEALQLAFVESLAVAGAPVIAPVEGPGVAEVAVVVSMESLAVAEVGSQKVWIGNVSRTVA